MYPRIADTDLARASVWNRTRTALWLFTFLVRCAGLTKRRAAVKQMQEIQRIVLLLET